jgi:hypothetical protein
LLRDGIQTIVRFRPLAYSQSAARGGYGTAERAYYYFLAAALSLLYTPRL